MNEGIVRKGKVSSVNAETREVRVYFPEDDFISGWLKVLNVRLSFRQRIVSKERKQHPVALDMPPLNLIITILQSRPGFRALTIL